MGSIIGIDRETIVDKNEGGNIISDTEKITSRLYVKDKQFFKLFIEDIAMLHKTSHMAKKVLFEIIKRPAYKNVEIAIGKHQKMQIAEELGLKQVSPIDKAIKNLIEKNVLVRVSRGNFMINPKLLAQGTIEQIRNNEIKYCELRIIYQDDLNK